MYPRHFADLLKGWLSAADHPGIAQVRTCAEIGRHEQPVGVAVTLADGWTFVLQCVGTYPAGGAANENPDTDRPEPFAGSWENRPDYQAARKTFDAEAKAYSGPRLKKPAATVTQLLAVALDAVKQADHPELTAVEVSASSPGGRVVLRVTSDDKAMIYGLPAGFIAPGATDLAHSAHHVPKEWA